MIEKNFHFHFRPKSIKEFTSTKHFEVFLNDKSLNPLERIGLLFFELIFYTVTHLIICFTPSYIDRFDYLSEREREDIRRIYERNSEDEKIFATYENLKGLSHFEKIKILEFASKSEGKIKNFCSECIYFVGKTYGEKYLHCSVHPLGLDEPICQDKALPQQN